MMEHLNNDRRRKLHILSDLKGFILFVLDENSKKKKEQELGFLKFCEGKVQHRLFGKCWTKKSYTESTRKSY